MADKLVPYAIPDQDADLWQCGRVDSVCRRCGRQADGKQPCGMCRKQSKIEKRIATRKFDRRLSKQKKDSDRCCCGHLRCNHDWHRYRESCKVCMCTGFKLWKVKSPLRKRRILEQARA